VFSVHALASGSSGNATLIKAGPVCFLIDAGIGTRVLSSHLKAYGVAPDELAGVVITHEHGDHIMSAHSLSRKYGVPIVANAATLARIYRGREETAHVVLPTGGRWAIGDLSVETFPVPHDAVDPVGVNIFHSALGQKVSHITDCGHISDVIRRAVRGSNLLVLEANHDVHRLHRSLYPGELKRRILGDRGHLSNEACVSLLCEHALSHGPYTVWLAHLSKENNTPKLALGYAKATVAVETGCPVIFDVAKRDKPSASWTPGARPVQLNLF
jgi:phosphoribosyl 1,2-cyclic phosphodiesterase